LGKESAAAPPTPAGKLLDRGLYLLVGIEVVSSLDFSQSQIFCQVFDQNGCTKMLL
jgi:hypothetical protein